MQLHPNDIGRHEEKKLLETKQLIGLGYMDPANRQLKQFKSEMTVGDIVLIRSGETVIALTEVIGELIDIGENISNIDWFQFRRKVKVLEFAEDTMLPFPKPMGTLQKSIGKKTKTYQYIKNWHNKIIQRNYNQKDLVNNEYKIKSTYIKNYKVLKDITFNFTDEDNTPLPIIVIAGKNGVGKTTVLEYLSKNTINDGDYIEIFKTRNPIGLEEWETNKNIIVETLKIEKGTSGILEKVKEYNDSVQYITVGINEVNDLEKLIIEYTNKMLRILRKGLNEVEDELKKSIKNIFNDLDLTFSFSTIDADDNIFFKNSQNEEFSINQLSTGEKTLLSKVLYLYLKDIKNKVILIDEPELSLHPSWQAKVLKIYEAFAKKNNNQIILATHSPHIINSAKNKYIRVLKQIDGKIEIINDLKAYGRDINSVLFDVMGEVPQRPKEFITKIDSLYNEIDQENFKAAKEKLNELILSFGLNDSTIIEAKMLIEINE